MKDFLNQFLVPLIFLAIWALTSLLNRESQSLPQRPARPGPRPGPGEADDGTKEYAPMRGRESGEPAPASRPSFSSSQPSREDRDRRPAFGLPPDAVERPVRPEVYETDGEIFYIDPTTRRILGSAPTGRRDPRAKSETPGDRNRGESSRRGGRSRRKAVGAGLPRTGDEETQRALSEHVGQAMAQNRGMPLVPLTSNLTSLREGSLRDAPSEAAVVTTLGSPPALSVDEIRTMIADTPRLRSLALLSELLQPPVSLRRSPRR